MDDEQIRKEVSLRLEIERQVREQLDKSEEKNLAPMARIRAWLDSKLALLIIGAVLSGMLVPTFQFTQEKLKWHRQNRYDNLQRQLTSMRESLKLFIAVQGMSAELYNLALEIQEAQTVIELAPRFDAWQEEFRVHRTRRIEKNATFAATMFYFPAKSQDAIRKAWNDMLKRVQKLEALVGDALDRVAPEASGSDYKEATTNEMVMQLDVSIAEINGAYERVLALLRRQLQEVEHESTKFQ